MPPLLFRLTRGLTRTENGANFRIPFHFAIGIAMEPWSPPRTPQKLTADSRPPRDSPFLFPPLPHSPVGFGCDANVEARYELVQILCAIVKLGLRRRDFSHPNCHISLGRFETEAGTHRVRYPTSSSPSVFESGCGKD